MEYKYRLGVIGYGNMAGAIVKGALAKGVLRSEEILVSDVSTERIEKDGLRVAKSNREVAKECRFILCSVKPQNSDAIFAEIKDSVCENVIISIMAGVRSEKIANALDNRVRVVRCMPNLPCVYGAGAVGIDLAAAKEDERTFILNFLGATGDIVEVEEDLLDAVTSISGSGPAYFYYFMQSMIDSGVRRGLDYETSKKLVLATALGSVKVLQRAEEPIDALIDKVCSKGGTTVQAIDCFRERGLADIVEEGVKRCYNRSKELSK